MLVNFNNFRLQISKDLKHPPHRLLSEYMSHVEEYYKIKEMESGYEKKRIYLSTYDPKLLNKLKHKYILNIT
jgi:glycoprotein 6-alpha-L-fucosyltransferase